MDSSLKQFLEDQITAVAIHFEDPKAFEEAAASAASQIDMDDMDLLPAFFHNNPPEPAGMNHVLSKYGLFGVWMNVVQDSIFEILFNYDEEAIPLLSTYAFEASDWTQSKAIRILCRLAQEGYDKEEIIEKIYDTIDTIPYEALMPTLSYLSIVSDSDVVDHLYAQYFEALEEEDPVDAFTVLTYWSVSYPNSAKMHLRFLKGLVAGKGLKGRSPLLDGAVARQTNDGSTEYYLNNVKLEGDFEEFHRINAAILYHKLDPDDAKINEQLNFWLENASKPEYRKMVRNHLEDKGK